MVVAEPTTVYRLFAHRRGYTLRPARLHLNPVPEQIPRRAWIPTTIRARHLDSPARLERRRRKYGEADPGGSDVGATAALLEPPRGTWSSGVRGRQARPSCGPQRRPEPIPSGMTQAC